MSEMRPWLETGADGDVAELLRAGRPAEPLDDGARERSRRRVRPLESSRHHPSRLEALPAAAGVMMWVQHAALGAGLGVVVAVTAAAPRLVRHFSEPSAPVNTAKAPQQAPRLEPPHGRAPSPQDRMPEESARSTQRLSGSVAAYPDSSAHGDNFELELLLIERARSELRHDPDVALRTLRSHRADFANGKLALEREILTITALVRLGRLVEARAYASSLRARAPGNLYDERLRQLLDDPAHVP
jgi:hypothetical protein